MGKNRNPYYKVYVGDELRLQGRLSTDAYGLYAIFRNWVHDAEPYGHLVDEDGQPLTDEAMIDMSGLKGSAFRAAFQDLCKTKAILSASKWLAQVKAKEHPKYVEAASELVAGVRCMSVVGGAAEVDAAPSEAMLIPALADQFVRFLLGQKTGGVKKGSVTTPVTGDVRRFPASHGDAQSQKSVSESESKAESMSSSGSEKEREAAAARAKGERGEPEISEKFTRWLRMQISQIRQSASLMAMAVNDPDAYRAEVRTLTGYSPEELAELAGDDGILPHEPDHRTSAYVVRLPRPKLPSPQVSFPFIRVGGSA